MSLASTTVYLYIGFDNQRRKGNGEWPHELGGHLELVDWLEMFAGVLEDQYTSMYADLDLGCVFDYEITEGLGAWLYDNTCADPSDFRAEANHLVALQVEEDNKALALWRDNDKRLGGEK